MDGDGGGAEVGFAHGVAAGSPPRRMGEQASAAIAVWVSPVRWPPGLLSDPPHPPRGTTLPSIRRFHRLARPHGIGVRLGALAPMWAASRRLARAIAGMSSRAVIVR